MARWREGHQILLKSRPPQVQAQTTTMRALGSGWLALPLLLLAVVALAEGDAKGLKEGETPGNFMEDEQWLSSISQYSGKIKHWNRFRDVSGGARRAGSGRARVVGGEAGSRDPARWEPPPRVGAGASRACQANYAKSKQQSQPLAPPVFLWPPALGPSVPQSPGVS